MNLTCLQCGHKFEDMISHDALGWHGACPKCGGSFDVDLPKGKIVMAFATKVDGLDPYESFTENIEDACIVSYYAFSSRKAFLEMWEKKVYDENPDGMWYWVIEGDNCITYGGPDPGDIELICDAWGIESDGSSFDTWPLVKAARNFVRTHKA